MRLILNSIVLHNFKSYKGTHTIKNIDKSFTAIVGPNGSGKSNVIDSILFVLGFRAKKMRHSQVTDLIYNDGRREKECFVELQFNKFRIKRSANINKTSKYFVNGEEQSSAAVVKMMMDEGVDMEHNRFLILQGEIESIAMMKPKEGLLEFLEDIIGTTVYKKEVESAQNEIKELEQTKADAQTSLAFIKKDYDHAEELKNQNEEAVREKLAFLKTKGEIFTIKNKIHKLKALENEKERERIGVEIEELRNSNEETRRIFETYEEKYQKAKKKLNEKEGAFLSTKREFKKLERHNDLQKEAKNRIEKKIKSLKQEIKAIASKNEVKAKEKEILSKELKENEEELEELYKSLEKNKKFLLKEEKKNKSQGDYKQLEESLIRLLDKKGEISLKRAKITAEIKCKVEDKENLEKEIEELKIKISRIDNTVKVDKSTRLDNTLKLERLEKDIALTQKELIKRKNRVAEASKKKECDLKEQEVMKHLEGVKGVVGRLQDVGRISPKYDTALRMACSKLNNIIVDSTSTADKCMEIIKRKNIPRTTLIVLEKVKEVPPLEKVQAPYLFELVECEDKFRKCFYFALTDTVVCEDLKEAEALAFGKKRRRVVSLDGKLIEKSGVMTGGKGVERVKSYEEIENSLKRMESLRKEYQTQLEEVEEASRYDTYTSKVKSKEETLRKTLESLSNLKKKEEGFECSSLEEEIEKTKRQIEEVKSKVESSLGGLAREAQVNLKIGSEKIEIIEKRNQEIKIYLAETSVEGIKEKEEEVRDLKKEVEKTQTVDLQEIRRKYETQEEEYNRILSTFKEAQEEMNNSKKKLGENYHNEIDLKNKYEDLEEKTGEIEEKVKKNKQEEERIRKEIEELKEIIGKDIRNDKGEDKESSIIEKDIESSIDTIGKDIDTTHSHTTHSHTLSLSLKQKQKVVENFISKEILPSVFEEFKSIRKSFREAEEAYGRVSALFKDKRKHIEELKAKRYEEFTTGFESVSKNLKEIYKTLTYGGNAQLELVDYLDPFSEGVVLAVMPPKKCWKNVNNLSGGEKTLSSLSLIFALHKYKPSPFYVMDEIDAALDYRNVSIISHYLKEMTKDSQFLIISLRNDMFEMSKKVLGVYKTKNVSKFLMIDVEKIRVV